MAAAGDPKGFKQDMVVSIRYRNDLPPPPMPPKLLDIDTGGIAQYLTTSFASALARREEPNIEVDAVGGMPIDMIGVPGYFLGDESAIMAPEIQPVLDPEDAALMLTADQLKTQFARSNVSFLRKTQYMTSGNSRIGDPLRQTNPRVKKPIENKPNAPLARDDKENVKRHVQKGFDVAYPDSTPYNSEPSVQQPTPQERDAWRSPIHPENSKLKPVSFHPILPDLEAVNHVGGQWTTIKFDKPPLPPIHGRRDDRIDVALLMGTPNQAQMPAYEVKKEAFDKQPDVYEDPGTAPSIWSLHVPKNPNATQRIENIFDDCSPLKNDTGLIEDLLEESAVDGTLRIPFERARVYPIDQQIVVNPRQLMAVSLVDEQNTSNSPQVRKQGAAAYYYPVFHRVKLRQDRGKLGKTPAATQGEEDIIAQLPDQLMVLPRATNELSATATVDRMTFRGENDSAYQKEWEGLRREMKAEQEKEKAEEIEKEQGTLHEGAQDVTMEEVEAADEAEVVTTNGIHRDDDRDNVGVNGHAGTANGVDLGREDDDADAMEDV